jgi:hypothetical protein
LQFKKAIKRSKNEFLRETARFEFINTCSATLAQNLVASNSLAQNVVASNSLASSYFELCLFHSC